ncbi:MAG: AbrB family transcriptional regulator [Betaproteobacteria bacterium RIFCSPLOWO2_12_FULL_68_19]|nr:MAG: AbrB family transcriptional regulator [Betaproteobacteria bacterium RIFCSPLOWO2_12_FULL_68_19]
MDRPTTAKLFRNGRSQAVRLPAKFRFEGADEVYVSKVGDKVVLSAKPSSWDDFFDAKPEGAKGFLGRRHDRPPQKRRLFR